MNNIVKVCKTHGDLTLEQTRKDGHKLRCKACRVISNKQSYENCKQNRIANVNDWKEKNKEHYNAWARQDRKNNPEKYRKYEATYISKHGIENLRKREVARKHGLTVKEYDQLFILHNNKCNICGKEETRLGRNKKTITPLTVDHCHTCENKTKKHIIRGLLCHACNTAIGKFKDNIEFLKSAIAYLENHKH